MRILKKYLISLILFTFTQIFVFVDFMNRLTNLLLMVFENTNFVILTVILNIFSLLCLALAYVMFKTHELKTSSP